MKVIYSTIVVCFILLSISVCRAQVPCGATNCTAGDQCCNDQFNGPQCYTSSYNCLPGPSGDKLCWAGDRACGVAPNQFCYDINNYVCVNGAIEGRQGVCQRSASQPSFNSTPSALSGWTSDTGKLRFPIIDGAGGLNLIPCYTATAASWYYPFQVCTSNNIYAKFVWNYNNGCNSQNIGDGIAFVIQTVGPVAIGDVGGNMGVEGVSPYGSTKGAFVAVVNVYGSTSVRVENTDSVTGVRVNVLQSYKNIPAYSDITTEIYRTSNTTYGVFINGVNSLTFNPSSYNFLNSTTSTPVYVGITAGTGASGTSFKLKEFTYHS